MAALLSGCQAQATVPPPTPLSAAPAPLRFGGHVCPCPSPHRGDGGPQGAPRSDGGAQAALTPAQAQARADELWQALATGQRVPWIVGTQVIFFYKGQAEQVSWRGSFNNWNEPGLAGARIGQTDLWIAYTEFPEASRVEYKIVLNGKDWLVDAANPNTVFSGLNGANNVVAMPGFSVSDESKKRGDVTPGALTGDLTITSDALGYPVNYRVYTPAG